MPTFMSVPIDILSSPMAKIKGQADAQIVELKEPLSFIMYFSARQVLRLWRSIHSPIAIAASIFPPGVLKQIVSDSPLLISLSIEYIVPWSIIPVTRITSFRQ